MGYRGRDPIDEFDGNDSGETKPPPVRSCTSEEQLPETLARAEGLYRIPRLFVLQGE